MRCGTSTLKGDTFDGVNSPAYPSVPSKKHKDSSTLVNSVGESAPTQQTQTTVPAPEPSSSATSKSRAPDPSTKSSKLSTLRQQWKERKGVPEPVDPVTGRGLHTGLTREEVKKLVESTRGAGTLEFPTGGIGTMEPRINIDPARVGRVRLEELEALKKLRSRSRAHPAFQAAPSALAT